MFRQILYTHLKWTRVTLLTLAVLAFAAPAGVWRAGHDSFHMGTTSAAEAMAGFAVLGPLLAILAFFAGFMLVAQPWAVDGAARHVYPLSLPVAWPRFLAMRFGAGALTLLIPTAALWLGSLLLLSFVTLPPTLHGYPGTLALRFLLGSLLSYAAVFLIQYLTGRRAAHLLLGILVGVIAIMAAFEFTGNHEATRALVRWLFTWPGPLAPFAADWMLIDV